MKYTAIVVSNLLWFEGEDQNICYDDILIDVEKVLPFVEFGVMEPSVKDLQSAALRFIEAHEARMYIVDEVVFELFE